MKGCGIVIFCLPWFATAMAGMAASSSGGSELVVYPGPAGVSRSDQYAVTLKQDGKSRDSFVYMVAAQKPDSNRSKTTSWTTFSFSGKVVVSVRKLRGEYQTCRILPTSRGIEPTLRDGAAEFSLDCPEKLAVEFDGDITHPMLVFADPLEESIPDPNDPNVIYFGPGVHDLREGLAIPSGKTAYLAGGAYVRGHFKGTDTRGVAIRGRGILSGELYPVGKPQLIRLDGWDTRDARIEGITLIQAPAYNLIVQGSGAVVRNVKIIGWHFSTDGVGTGRDSLVEDCFIKVNDDSLKLYHSNTTVRRCVIWQLENGAAFQISWNMPTDNSHFRVSDCDVIRCEHRWNNKNSALFNSIHGGAGQMSDYVFENIRIENAPWRLVRLTMEKTKWSEGQQGYGQISDIVFRNVAVAGPMERPNIIQGHDAQHRISNVAFEDVTVNGKRWTCAADGQFEIDSNSTENIHFGK